MVTVDLDGTKVPFDQMPVIENGRTLVPVRFIADSFGVNTDWDAAARQVKLTTK